MPELPEAETIARGLRAAVVDRAITAVEVLREDLLTTPRDAFVETLNGSVIREIGRRGKNLVLTVDAVGDKPRKAILVVNLGMSGRLVRVAPKDTSAQISHPGMRFRLDDASTLVYHDIRRFGRLSVLTPLEYRRWSRTLGPEPLASGFGSARLVRDLARSASPVRSWLLDQHRVAGVGNIYANEALFRARIHPAMPANSLTVAEGRRLHRALRAVLREAVEARGTTLRDYRTAEGWQGSYAVKLRVYGKEDRACPRCGGRIERLVFGGRSAFLCSRCQPMPE